MTLLFHSLGATAVGIDADYVDPRPSFKSYLAISRDNGWERALKTLVRAILFDRSFYRRLGRTFGGHLKRETVDVRVMDARALQFPDNSFDYACSFSVFEHINDIDAATRELSRVLKPGGIAYIVVHLFPSISGGHHFEWMSTDRPSKKVPPWDHIRKNLYPSQSYLNKLRERDYMATFSKYLTIRDVTSAYEGEQMLTPEIERELPRYTRDELLKNSIAVVLQRP